MKRKLTVISDQHGNLPEIEPCDLLIIAGDICPITDHRPVFQATWLDMVYREWLKSVPAEKIIYIAGNHDFVFENPHLVPLDLPATYLEDTSCDWCGWKIYGTPWVNLGGWAFHLPENKLEDKWAKIPGDTDILITHGPPFGIGDHVIAWPSEPEYPGNHHCGSPSLRQRIDEITPSFVFFGHIHECYGSYSIGDTVLMNAAILDEKYRYTHAPSKVEVEIDEGQTNTLDQATS